MYVYICMRGSRTLDSDRDDWITMYVCMYSCMPPYMYVYICMRGSRTSDSDRDGCITMCMNVFMHASVYVRVHLDTQ